MKQREVNKYADSFSQKILAGESIKAIKAQLKKENISIYVLDKIIIKIKNRVSNKFTFQAQKIIKEGGAEQDLSTLYANLATDTSKQLIKQEIKKYKQEVRKSAMVEMRYNATDENLQKVLVDYQDHIIQLDDVRQWIFSHIRSRNEQNNSEAKRNLIIGSLLLLAAILVWAITSTLMLIGFISIGTLMTLWGLFMHFSGQREMPDLSAVKKE